MSSEIWRKVNTQLKGATVADVLDEGLFKDLLIRVAASTSNNIEMMLLPVLTAASGLMGKCVARPWSEKNFMEKNILWTCVAAPPGSRKTIALQTIMEGLTKVTDKHFPHGHHTDVQEVTQGSQPLNNSFTTSRDNISKLWSANETITMSKLHEQLASNNGIYLNIIDEIEGLFELLETRGRPDVIDRRRWLSLNSGMPWCRGTPKGLVNVTDIRMNYTGYCQPQLLAKRLEKGDVDGLMDRHWVMLAERKEITYKEMGSKVKDNEDLGALFLKIYEDHNVSKTGTIMYKMSADAEAVMSTFYDATEDEIRDETEEENIGMLNKAAGVYNALTPAEMAAGEDGAIVISEGTMKQAVRLIGHMNTIKASMASNKEGERKNARVIDLTNESSVDLNENATYVRSIMSGEKEWTPRSVVTAKNCKPNGRNAKGNPAFKSDDARALLASMASQGLGEVVAEGKRHFVFKRKNTDELSEHQKKLCCKAAATK